MIRSDSLETHRSRIIHFLVAKGARTSHIGLVLSSVMHVAIVSECFGASWSSWPRTWEMVTGQLLDIYRQLLGTHRPVRSVA